MIEALTQFRVPRVSTVLLELGVLGRYSPSDVARDVEVFSDSTQIADRLLGEDKRVGVWGPEERDLVERGAFSLARRLREEHQRHLELTTVPLLALPGSQARGPKAWMRKIRENNLELNKVLVISRTRGSIFAALEAGVCEGILVSREADTAKGIEMKLRNPKRQSQHPDLRDRLHWVRSVSSLR